MFGYLDRSLYIFRREMLYDRAIPAILICTCLFLIFCPLLQATEVRILTENDQQLRLEVRLSAPLEWRVKRDLSEGTDYITIGEANLRPLNSGLLVPYFEWIVALPSEVKPQLSYRIITSELQKLPFSWREEEYTRLNAWPVVDFAQIGWMGNNPAGTLVFHPLRVGNNPDEVEVIRAIEITIRFASASSPTYTPQVDLQSKAAFLNAQTALRWHQPPRRQLAKSTVYPTGKWFRLTINQDAVYHITLSDLQSAGLPLTQIDTSRLLIYTNSTGGRPLPDTYPDLADPALIEIARELRGNKDGYFTVADTLIFWGRGSSGIGLTSSGKLKFERNVFSSSNYYWLLLADEPQRPKVMTRTLSLTAAPDYATTTTDLLERQEIEAVNFLHSGRNWYGDKFNGSSSSVSKVFNIYSQNPSVPAEISIRTKGATEKASYSYRLYINDFTTPVASWSSNSYASVIRTFTTNLNKGANYFRITITTNPTNAVAYLDYIDCLYSADLTLSTAPLQIWAPLQSGIIQYTLSNATQSNYTVYDVSDWQNVHIQEYVQDGATLTFRARNSTPNRSQYYVCTPNQRAKPAKIEQINSANFQELHASDQMAEYIIITDEKLVSAANDLAKLHTQDVPVADRLITKVVTQQQILREFHGEVTDPNAIRNFLRYAFLNWNIGPSYVLLFGDGTYDYRGIESTDGNIVLTYQVEPYGESGEGFDSYAADCRFTYIHGNDQLMDLAIGRINVRTLQDAQRVVAKIRKYVLEPEYGDWRSQVTLVADDPQRPLDNEQYHINDSENYLVPAFAKRMNIQKLYLLEFPEVQDASTYGVKKPAATEALLKQLAKGTTIINYLGHGSPTVWAQEYVLVKDRDLGKINTGMRLPLWIGATCSWGQFDQISVACMPEALLLENFNGAIAAIAATRPTYPTPNRNFIVTLLSKWFGGNKVNRLRIGEVFKMSLIGNNENSEKYILFGDPALYLALPYSDAKFHKLPTDTLYTLQNVTLKGQVNSNSNANFSGTGSIRVMDSERQVTRQYLDNSKTLCSMSYILPGEVLYYGNIQVTDNLFQTRFFIPKDINYENRLGRIIFYCWNTNTSEEAGGYYDSLSFQGGAGLVDTTGPTIQVKFQDIDFRNGDVVTPGASLTIKISDPVGINITGQLGHEITVQFDQNQAQPLIVTDDFSYDLDSDTSGTIHLALPELTPGAHTLDIKAWDNANNSAEVVVNFTLLMTTKLHLES